MRRCGNKYFRMWCVYCVSCSVRLAHNTARSAFVGEKNLDGLG